MKHYLNNRESQRSIKRIVYIAIFAFLVIFLFNMGAAPWLLLVKHIHLMIIVMGIIGLGIIVQAESFRCVCPSGIAVPPLWTISRIWAASATISVIAPVFAGLATRTILIAREGMPVSICLLASARQVWMGLEYAALFGGLVSPFLELPMKLYLSAALLSFWVAMLILRTVVITQYTNQNISDSETVYGRFVTALKEQLPLHAHIWFILQLMLMSAVFYVAFNGFGAELHWQLAVALSSATVLISLIAFAPNGIGISDGLWVIVATQSGMSLEASVALALLLRISHLLGASLLYAGLWCLHKLDNNR